MKAIGAVLILAAIGAFAWGMTHGGMRFSRQDKLVVTGPDQGSVLKTNSFPLAPIAGGILLLAGVIVLVASAKQATA